MTREDRRNAFLYCKFRDMQYALYDEYAKRNGLSMKSLLVLNALYYAKEGMTQKDICERTFNSKQTVSLIVKGLLQARYITLEEDADDKRHKRVRMTDEGRAYARKPIVHITRAEDTAMSMLSPQEQETLVSLSRRFTQNLTELINGSEDEP